MIRGSMSTASMCRAPFERAIATSEPDPAPMISTLPSGLPGVRWYGKPYCGSSCRRWAAARMIWWGTPLTEMSVSGMPPSTLSWTWIL